MLETWHLVCKYTQISNFRKYIFQYQGSPDFDDISIFGGIVTSLKVIVVSCVRDFLVLFSIVFVRQKIAITENVSFTYSPSRNWLLDCSKLVINEKIENDP